MLLMKAGVPYTECTNENELQMLLNKQIKATEKAYNFNQLKSPGQKISRSEKSQSEIFAL